LKNFTYWNPTKLIFGRGEVNKLAEEIKSYGRNILLVYGGGSIKRNGLYDQVINNLNKSGFSFHELAGVEPNPRLGTVNKGIAICKEKNIDFLLAIGGGSVIDCTKAIAAGAKYDGDAWDIITKKHIPTDALPLGTILTIAATGSEMNSGAGITNWDTKEKYGWNSPYVFPKFSILDPVNTFTVPKNQTVYGIVDMMSHVLEQYIHHIPNTDYQDRMCESLLKTVIETAPKLLQDLENYEFRETILFTGTIALNNMLSMGANGDWATHYMEHPLSALYDIPHAGGIAILFPNWMRHVLSENPGRFKQLAVRVFDIETKDKSDEEVGLEGIEKMAEFWSSLGAPSKLSDYGIMDEQINLIADKVMVNGEFGHFKQLNREDVLSILKHSL